MIRSISEPSRAARLWVPSTGGAISSYAGALLLGATDKAIRLAQRFAACFRNGRKLQLIDHRIETLMGQRVFDIALG